MKLSVIMPVYNQAGSIRQVLEKADSVVIDKEIIVVDDGSTDGTDRVLRESRFNNLKIIHHTTRRGQGAAFLTGLSQSNGEFIIIQEPVLEYEPEDYSKMLDAIAAEGTDIILGARFSRGYRGLFIHKLGNVFLTGLINILFRVKLNDYSRCYKLMRREAVNTLELKAQSSVINAEIVAKFLKKKLRLREVPVSRFPRTYFEGRKIRWKHGFQSALSIVRYRFGK